jgi:hypothetical protein
VNAGEQLLKKQSAAFQLIGPQPETIGECLLQNVAAFEEFLPFACEPKRFNGSTNAEKITATLGCVNGITKDNFN